MSELHEHLDTVRSIVIEQRSASVALVQRRLRLSYALALDLMEALRREGLVSAPDEHGMRKYLGNEV